MRLFISGSAPLLPDTHRQFRMKTGQAILERYGMTETGMNTSNPVQGMRRAGTVGLPLMDVEVRVSDRETGAALPKGQDGMIEVKGPNVFAGYWRNDEKTREAFRDDGYFITGDLGRIEADNYLVISGRANDLIISGGFNVYPREVELVLDGLPGVAESAVIGVPHADFGEGVVAVVVMKEGAAFAPASLAAQLADRLANFKQPKAWIEAAELPRNAMGKVQKNVLRAAHRDVLKA
jgi:malonyl-CoA/methylmalonyl-CoA synthetase